MRSSLPRILLCTAAGVLAGLVIAQAAPPTPEAGAPEPALARSSWPALRTLPQAPEAASLRPVMLAQLRPGEPPPPPARPEPPHPGPLPPDRAGPPPHRPPPGPMEIAGLLAAQEIALGIRADQLDVWRAYAVAVVDLASAQAPAPPPVPPSDTPEPFALSQALASRAVEMGEKGKVVLEARTALLAKLSPAQIERARKLDLPPPHPLPPPPPRMP